jgi:hypothetical protein
MKARWAVLLGLAVTLVVTGGLDASPGPVFASSTSTHHLIPVSAAVSPQKSVSIVGPRGFRPYAVEMVSTTTGWAWSRHHLWWTQDGGRHWTNVTPLDCRTQASTAHSR